MLNFTKKELKVLFESVDFAKFDEPTFNQLSEILDLNSNELDDLFVQISDKISNEIVIETEFIKSA